MTDRELLELAAKAAGYTLEVSHVGGKDNLYLYGELLEWNPLKDDGDAQRLAVALCMNLRHDSAAVTAGWTTLSQSPFASNKGSGPWNWKEWLHDHPNDRFAATRRAIVRAAAAMAPN